MDFFWGGGGAHIGGQPLGGGLPRPCPPPFLQPCIACHAVFNHILIMLYLSVNFLGFLVHDNRSHLFFKAPKENMLHRNVLMVLSWALKFPSMTSKGGDTGYTPQVCGTPPPPLNTLWFSLQLLEYFCSRPQFLFHQLVLITIPQLSDVTKLYYPLLLGPAKVIDQLVSIFNSKMMNFTPMTMSWPVFFLIDESLSKVA